MNKLSIIIPAFNEAARITPTLHSFHSFLENNFPSFEILVVDDGSTDETVTVVRSLMKELPRLKIIVCPGNKGKGNAVRAGMLAATGDMRLFSDADGSTPITEISKLLQPLLNNECDIAIGSRYAPGSEVVKAQPLYRRIWSRAANKLVQRILLPGIADPHCGFKCFKGDVAEKLFSLSKVNEWSFDLEILALALKFEKKIVEVPVKWIHDEQSKGRIRQVPQEIRNLRRIKKSMSEE
ncbi:MAG TPA: dolichyl-phosphate beta-glucosyltransferase [Bacteroidia bacterium]|nr:dolichyl-phosphate beta-glucosyltransferase [Bacteroidia bacterium]